ncbi:MAG: L-seryl-tRNA(Sec) selenium transferase [Calditrichaeota bacterium]|nr:L-seryl-tRNA(Sec) selenium transferase [Calditrichota bacterium]MCB9368317.1 L-seryl-tRNA(Sec) selenium transferase [Calditrichota bacterium]
MAESDARRTLPGVDRLLERPEFRNLRESVSVPLQSRVIREEIDFARAKIEQGKSAPDESAIAHSALSKINAYLNSAPRRVINATGIILHTGLGRASLSETAIKAVVESAGYCDLEIDMDTGQRGDRQTHVESLLCWLTGAEAALMVNNNAAALFLVLNTLASKREVIVSRGQLIEIGGSFRLPEIMSRAGAKLVEVGTTNRTRIADFAAAVTDKSVMLLRAYPSNYRIDGFTESVVIKDLADLARKHGLLCVDDLGGGLLWDWAKIGLPEEPHVAQSLADGADLVLVSGDKVLGGPQAGLIMGKKSLVQKLKKSPLARVLRPGKLEVAALSATLNSFLHPDRPNKEIPAWQMFSEPLDTTRARAASVKQKLAQQTGWQTLDVRELPAYAGSGTLPAEPLPSFAVACLPENTTAARWSKKLRQSRTPIVSVVQDDLVCLNMRTVADSEIDLLCEVISESH